jgi:hypothetical protein
MYIPVMSNWLLQHVTAVLPQSEKTVEVNSITFYGYLLELDHFCERQSTLIYAKNDISFDDLQKARYVMCVSEEGGSPVPLQFFKIKLTERALLGYDEEPTTAPLEILDEESGCVEKLTLDDEGQPLCLHTTRADGSKEVRNYQFDYSTGKPTIVDYQRYDADGQVVSMLTFPASKFEMGQSDREDASKKDYNFLCELFELETKKSDILLF